MSSSSTPVLDHLLRTLAAVSPEQHVLVLGAEGDGRHYVDALARLGFEVHACTRTDAAARAVSDAVEAGDRSRTGRAYATVAAPGGVPYPDAHFGWVVARGRVAPPLESLEDHRADEKLLAVRLAEARRVVRPGGWVFTVAPASWSAEALGRKAKEAGLAEAEAPTRADGAKAALRAIYRRVEEGTPL